MAYNARMNRWTIAALSVLSVACESRAGRSPRAPEAQQPDSDTAASDTGAGDSAAEVETDPPDVVDADGDGYAETEDCDDSRESIHPNATEVCDGVDQDCDGAVDDIEGKTWWVDGDGDGFGAGDPISACTTDTGMVDVDGDCDDADAGTHPGACDQDTDLDCDGSVDPCLDAAVYTVLGPSESRGREPFDYSGAFATDLDGDGVPDIAHGYPGMDWDAWGQVYCSSAVYLYLSSSMTPGENDRSTPDAGQVLTGPNLGGPQRDDCLGMQLGDAGDVDGDGLHDLLVGAPGDPQAGSGGTCSPSLVLDGVCAAGKIHVVSGADLVSGTRTLSADGPGVFGSTSSSSLGSHLSPVGDVDDDGRADFAFLDLASESAFIQTGGSLGSTPTSAADVTLRLSLEAEPAAVGGVGDVDGDGLDDWAVGTDEEAPTGAYVFLGGLSGVIDESSADAWLGASAEGTAGGAVGTAGDVDGDGLSDVVIAGTTPTVGAWVLAGADLADWSSVDDAFATILVGEAEWDGQRPAVSTDLEGDGDPDTVFAFPGLDAGVVTVFDNALLASGGALTPGTDGDAWFGQEESGVDASHPGQGLAATDSWLGIDHGAVLFFERNTIDDETTGRWHWQYRAYLLSL